MTRSLLLSAAMAASALLVTIHGQTAAPPATASFEVASIKPNTSGELFIRFGMQPGGRITVTNAPLREIIRFAHKIQDFQIVGAPDWARSARFDIVAKMPGDIPSGPQGPGAPLGVQDFMMQNLLAERFMMKAHKETREMPIYELVMARADRQPGAKLTTSTTDCAALMKARMAAGGPPPPPLPNGRVQCGLRMGFGDMNGGAVPLGSLASALSVRMGRTVIDRTGLTGNWDFALTFMPDQIPQMPPGPPPPNMPPPPAIDPNAPSLMTALEEQLGLKLVSTKGPVDVLVIDAVSQPTRD